MKNLAECRLYAFIDSAYLHGRAPEALAEELCRGGADLIQLRAKGWPVTQVQEMAERVLPVTRAAGVRLVINDHFQVARACGAEVCHLGQEDFFDAGYQQVSDLRVGFAPEIGLSTHGPADAVRALSAKPDYIAIGPVFQTATKPEASPVTLEYVRWAARHVEIPWFAIGGITLANLEEVLQAGATRICVVSAILNAPDVAAACRQFRDRLP